MEVKEIVGLGTTIDVLVVNGRIREGDTIIVGGVDGPIITQVGHSMGLFADCAIPYLVHLCCHSRCCY